MQIGVDRNPDHPYQDPRVDRHINDGRAFLENTDNKYDLILFALPDSPGAGQRRLADPAGVVPVHRGGHHRGPRPPHRRRRLRDVQLLPRGLADRPARRHRRGGVRPRPLHRHRSTGDRRGGRGEGPGQPDRAARTTTTCRRRTSRRRPTTRRSCTTTAACCPASTCGRSAASCCSRCCSVRVFGGPFRSMRPYADLFFMGAAFLLLETKNIATFALLFGTTWIVNAMVFAGVLLIVLAAVETTRRFRTPPLPVVFAGDRAVARARLGGPAGVAAGAAVLAAAGGRHPARVPADLPGEHRVRQTVPAGRGLPGGVRHQPARRHRRRLPGVRRAAHRLPQPAARGRRDVPRSRSCSSRRTTVALTPGVRSA